MKHKMTKEDLDSLEIIKDFDFDRADHSEYREFLRAVMHFVGYRVKMELLPPDHSGGERRCPTCKHEILWPHRYCQFCGQMICDSRKEAANKKAAQVAKEAAAKRKEAKRNAGKNTRENKSPFGFADDRSGYLVGLQECQESEDADQDPGRTE